MKYILIILFPLSSMAQFIEPPIKPEPKPNYTHIVIYRYVEPFMVQNGDMMTTERKWNTHIKGFTSIDEVMIWLNSGRDHWHEEHQNVKLDSSQMIGIYDIRSAKEIKVKLLSEEKVVKKHIEIQEDKWTEHKYILE